jgi:uncharacterized phage-associated protein
MYSVLEIADEILKIAKRKGVELTPMQLMKLVYIAHGWSLAILEKDLFSDRIEAWKYGPVIPVLYQATKRFGRKSIPFELISDEEPSPLKTAEQSFLEDVFDKYGHLDGIQLSSLTHKKETPWDLRYVPDMQNIEIPDDLIKQHYKDKLNEYKQRTAAA